ncbi:hypothetical protein TNIN_42381, partial [Trichonephila inaurata madagascariensis]
GFNTLQLEGYISCMRSLARILFKSVCPGHHLELNKQKLIEEPFRHFKALKRSTGNRHEAPAFESTEFCSQWIQKCLKEGDDRKRVHSH